MAKNSFSVRAKAIIAILAGVILVIPAGAGQTVVVQHNYTLGSPNTATADPPVQRPHTRPCIVTLFQNYTFENFNPQSFSYAPPAECPGPWAKVVFVANFGVSAGVQYDRTGNIWMGATNIWFGTTPEPMSNFGPTWHVEKDLTDYSSLFTTAQTGTVDIFNLVNSQYTGIINGSAAVELYPLAHSQTAPRTADVILPLSASPTGGTVALNTTTDQLSGTFTMPTNIESAYLDVYAQGQSSDEFWYTCVPSDVASELQSCSGTAFREAEVSIDGTPAGVAPVYPWIFTGGIDPYLWTPTPGVQTLDFVPYRVDLSPFAGLLSNGQQHTVALSVFNADSYFSATASLLLYLDSGSTQVTGAVTHNTLSSGPTPVVEENVKMPNGNTEATIKVTSERTYIIAGYVDTSHGRVKTEVSDLVDFSSTQRFNITPTEYVQNITQKTDVASTTAVTNRGLTSYISESFGYPLRLTISVAYNQDGSGTQTTRVNQQFNNSYNLGGQHGSYNNDTNNVVMSEDALDFNAQGMITGNSGQRSSQHYTFSSEGPNGSQCYDRMVRSAKGVLVGVQNGCSSQ